MGKKPAVKKSAKKSAKKTAKVVRATAKVSRPVKAAKAVKKGKTAVVAASVATKEPTAKLPTKGVLIRLKKPVDKEAAAAEEAKNRSYTERSNGSTPITLHHRKPTKPEIAEFRELLVVRQRQLKGDVEGMQAEAFSAETQVVSTNHLADTSFEQYEQEFTISMMENETEELREIGRALDKIEGGTFGVCESCGVDISIERLRAMPYTRICIHCRGKFELEGGGERFGVVPERRV